MKTAHLKSIGRSPLRLGVLFIPLVLICFRLAPTPNAFGVDPPPDGGYPGDTTAEGDNALFSLTTGFYNTAIGFDALYYNTDQDANTAIGFEALLSNTGGNYNTATGAVALAANSTGIDNVATGVFALYGNIDGDSNTASGAFALQNNTSGNSNTATGTDALLNNTTASFNTANGVQALFSNTTGGNNTANGYEALRSNTTGINNTANGYNSLFSNTIGNYNTASGQGALSSNTMGRNNTADGQNALRSNTTGSFNIALGSNAGINLTTGSNNIDIFDRGVAGEANTIHIGSQGTQTTTFIAGISGATVPTGVPVIVDARGHLGTTTSSARFKEAIKPMDKASETILALKPVSFRYKREIDPKRTPQFGLVAEEVEKINPDLVARDADGKPYTVRYEAVNAMLLNEFIKEHRKVQALEKARADEQREIAELKQQVKAQAAAIQKVSDQLDLSRPLPQVVDNW